MSARRGLALVMMVVTLTTVSTSAAAAIALTTGAAAAKPTICVALVVDGRALGSDVSTSCATVTKGATGIDVLEAGGHRVGFRNDGLLCTIDGLPRSGCASVSDTHYWAYFHRAPGSTKWVYSSEGSSTYQPANDSTDGWVYDNGKALTPDNVPYAQICKTEPTAKPTASVSHPPTATPSGTPPAASTAPANTTPSPPSIRASHQHSAKPPRTAAAASAAAITTPTASTTSAVLAGAPPPPSSNHHGLLDLLIGLAVVAALGIAAAVRFRRSPR